MYYYFKKLTIVDYLILSSVIMSSQLNLLMPCDHPWHAFHTEALGKPHKQN